MADLTINESSQSVRLVGNDEANFLDIDSNNQAKTINETIATNGAVKPSKSALIAGSDGTSILPLLTDSLGQLITTGQVTSSYPAFREFFRSALAGTTVAYKSVSITQDIALKEFHVGGRVACEGTLSLYAAATTEQITGGGFNSSGDVSLWTNTSMGSSASVSWVYATDQFTEGTGSAKLTFTQSDNNNYPEITYTFSTPKDMSGWRYIKANARVTVAAGGSQTRTVQVRLTSGTAIRIYSITGTTTTAPFSTEQWHYIIGELETPTSTAGTGTFDINSVNSISLRLQDGGNKAGSIWWDDVELSGQISIIDKIYSMGGTTSQIVLDPIYSLMNGDVLLLTIRNNSATAGEVQIEASGVDIT